jgi:aromatic ring-opening dioxygenase catalytic subunit (LigB family)
MGDADLTRRAALLGLTATTAAAALGVATGGPMGKRLPVTCLPHGGGPWPFVELGLPKADIDSLAGYLRGLAGALPEPPKALLVISAHWEERVPTVMTSPRPPMVFDYHGFPEKAYTLSWPAPGAPWLAARVRELLGSAGLPSAEDPARGFDHGTFIPLMLSWPGAEVPTVQLSLQAGLDPAAHIALGRALAPLRDEGVYIIGSGMSFHNLRGMRDPRMGPQSETFDAWLQEAVSAPPAERDARLIAWAAAPSGRVAHPREEHLLPLMVIAGAAGEDAGTVPWSDRYMGWRISAAHFG